MRRESKLDSGSLLLLLVIVLVLVGVVADAAASDKDIIKIWPMPVSATYGQQTVCVGPNLNLVSNHDPDSILSDAFRRMLHLPPFHSNSNSNSSASACSHPPLQAIHVVLLYPHPQLQYGVDESYKLLLPSSHDPRYALLQAQTVYGALHGLQTFSQLCQYNFATRTLEVRMAPWIITDQPRFSFRGLLIDTSRHYQPTRVIKKVIDSMAYAKLNVLHWHIVDTQSFPLEMPSFPKLWNGAYSPAERYTVADAADIVRYAQRRGINVLAEIDIPGHALSWGSGYPSLWPSKDCQQPLDVSNEFTFQVIDGILSDFSKVFPFKFAHLGGDEVNTSCWTSTPRIRKWLKQKGMDESQAYQYFVLRGQQIALKHGYEMVNWEETFSNFGDKLSRKTVVHNWLGPGVAQVVVKAGLRCIVSNQDKWYLDHLDTPWQDFYMNEPLANITDAGRQKLVIGGEVCMWGETVDASNIEQTIWPRAAAAAERLWTAYDKLAKDAEEVGGRLAKFRCLLNERGVAAAPLYGLGRGAPIEPGSCYVQ